MEVDQNFINSEKNESLFIQSCSLIHFNAFISAVKVQPALKQLTSQDVSSFKPLCLHISSSLCLESSYHPFCTWQKPVHLCRPSSNAIYSVKLFKIFIQPSSKISHTILYLLMFCSYFWHKADHSLFTQHVTVQLVVRALSPHQTVRN